MPDRRVLVVDDNPVNLRLTQLLLRGEGYTVQTAPDAETAQELVSSFQPRLILMDVQLPGMDGLTLTRLLKAAPATRSIAIIAVTAYSRRGDRETALEAGCDGYVTKPINRVELLALADSHFTVPPPVDPSALAQPSETVSERPHVLIVEDHAATATVAAAALRQAGYAVTTVADGSSAILHATRQLPHLVLQSVKLPDMHGTELVRMLRDMPGGMSIPVLGASNLLDSSDASLLIDGAYDDLVTRPLEPNILLETVAAHLPLDSDRTRPGAGKRLLLIENDPLTLKLNTLRLKNIGFDVTAFNATPSALDFTLRRVGRAHAEPATNAHPADADDPPPDVIVLDVQMPDMDGFAFCLAARRVPALERVPIILMSPEEVDDEDRALTLEVGANRVACKQNFDSVIIAIRECLDGHAPRPTSLGEDVDARQLERVSRQLERQLALNARLARRLAVLAARLAVMAGTSDVLARSAQLDVSLHGIFISVLEVCGLSDGVLYMRDHSGSALSDAYGRLVPRANAGISAVHASELEIQLRPYRSGAFENTTPDCLDVTELPTLQRLLPPHTRWLIRCPIHMQRQSIGLLLLTSPAETRPDEDMMEFLQAVLAQMAQAIVLTETIAQAESERQRYKAILEHANDGVGLVNQQRQLVEVNTRLEHIYDRPRGELVNQPLHGFIASDDHPVAEELLERVLNQGSGRGRIRAVQPSGRLVDVEVSAARIKMAGEFFVLGIFRDVTARLATERRRNAEHAVTRIIADSPTLEEATPRIFGALHQGLRFDAACLWTLDEVKGALRNSYAWSPHAPTQAALAAQTLAPDDEIVSQAGMTPRMTRIFAAWPGDFRVEAGFRRSLTFKVNRVGRVELLWADNLGEDNELCDVATSVSHQWNGFAERKNAEQSLRRAEEQYRLLLDSTAEGVYCLDVAGRVTFMNRSCEQMLGVEDGELLGHNAHQRFHRPHEQADDGHEDQDTCEVLLATLAGIGAQRDDEEFRRKDGSHFPVEYTSRPIMDETGIVGTVVACSDITERRRHEQRQAAQYEVTRILAETTSLSTAADRVLDVLCKTLGFELGELWTLAATGQQLTCTNAWSANAHFAAFATASRGMTVRRGQGLPARAWETGHAAFLNGPFPSSFKRAGMAMLFGLRGGVAFPVMCGGEACAALAFFTPRENVTDAHVVEMLTAVSAHIGFFIERLRGEQALRESEEKLLQSQKLEAIGTLAGGIAHDFNNMLSAILGYSEMLLADLKEGDDNFDSLNEILRAGERAAVLTRQLLTFSRKQARNIRSVEFNRIVTDMEKMLRRLIGEDILLTTSCDPAVKCVMGDAGQFDQLLMNLVVNARDAMPRGGRIDISTRLSRTPPASLPEGEYVVLSVQDEGCGIDPETLERIFEPFFTTKDVGRGTGLGLSTVYGIVQQSGGDIAIESEVGQGTKFDVYLPHEADMSSTTPQAVSSTGYPQVGSGQMILIVEDEPAVRQLTREILERHGFTVTVAASPSDALGLLADPNVHVDLLLTDVVMPGMSGFELARRLLEERPHLRVLFLSGYTEDTLANHGLPPHTGIVHKPFTPATLSAKLIEALGSRPDTAP